jgi:hypothetical protein
MMLAGPAIGGMASGKTAISSLRSASLSSLVVSVERPPGRPKISSIELQQKQYAGSYLESRHADLQEPKKLRTANREDDENAAGYDNRLEGEATSLGATGARGQDPEDGSGLQRPDGDQKHQDCRCRKFEGAPHFLRPTEQHLQAVWTTRGRPSRANGHRAIQSL